MPVTDIKSLLTTIAPQDVTVFVDNDEITFQDADDNQLLSLHPREAMTQCLDLLGMMVEEI